MDGGLAAIELDGRRPEPPDGVERRAVGVEEDRDPPGARQRDQVAVEPMRRRGRARAGERQGGDVAAQRLLDAAVHLLGLVRRDGGVRVEERGLLGGRLGADRQDDPRRRGGRDDQRVDAVVRSEQGFAGGADRAAEERDRPRTPGRAAAAARATLFPLPPTTSRTAVPRTRSPGRQGGTVSVLSRQALSVTHRIMARSPTKVSPIGTGPSAERATAGDPLFCEESTAGQRSRAEKSARWRGDSPRCGAGLASDMVYPVFFGSICDEVLRPRPHRGRRTGSVLVMQGLARLLPMHWPSPAACAS